MAALAVIYAALDWIGKIATAINGCYTLYQNIDEFGNTPNWFSDPNGLERQQFDRVMYQIRDSRNQILDACANIFDAITQLRRDEFFTTISDKLGDAEQARLALDNWVRQGDPVAKSLALYASGGALEDLRLMSSSGAYRDIELFNVSLLVPLVQVLLIRMLILEQVDPQFSASENPTKRQVEDSIKFVRDTIEDLEDQISDFNRVSEKIWRHVVVYIDPDTGGKVKEWVTHIGFHYENICRTVAYSYSNTLDSYEDHELESIVAVCRVQALAARDKGLADDISRAQIETMRNVADTAERILRR